LGLVLDAASPTPLHRQIGEQVRRAIFERRLAPGQRLPS
jgi:GntR family transcriptional regulator/MocR family aminotransferase